MAFMGCYGDSVNRALWAKALLRRAEVCTALAQHAQALMARHFFQRLQLKPKKLVRLRFLAKIQAALRRVGAVAYAPAGLMHAGLLQGARDAPRTFTGTAQTDEFKPCRSVEHKQQ
jgi:hypothetical protein